MAPLVDNPQIKSAELLVPLSIHYHAYVWPFVVLWPVFFFVYLSPEHYERHLGAQEWAAVWGGTILTLQSLIWLSTNWSVDVKAVFTATKTKSVAEAQLVKVIPIANAGVPEICKLERSQVCFL